MTETFSITSTAFEQNGRIPSKYTCDGDRTVSPPLTFSGVPETAKALVLIMDDPDVPKALRPDGVFDHWVAFNIPADTNEIPEGGPVPGVAGANGAGTNAYTGPCPPPQYEPNEHRYIFKLYALDSLLSLDTGATKNEILDALVPFKIAEAELIGRYSRK
ncbi:MAG: YbhB/YbcL family Raf kinase inhibitor-like protein [bacterium]|nr:YbhB/YbcL family Raf kinase inhibitor-like protein [bacterium]